jgi:hypothetical protein
MPIIGIQASAISGNLWPANSYESIATVTVGAGGSASVSFTSIPATYTHLQIRGIVRTATSVSLGLRFNSDTGANYSRHYLNGSGTAAASGGTAGTTMVFAGTAAQAASTFGTNVIDILDYTNTNKYKTTRTLSGSDNNGSGYLQMMSGNWRNTNAVTSIDVFQVEADTFTEYSTFALYGIKGS